MSFIHEHTHTHMHGMSSGDVSDHTLVWPSTAVGLNTLRGILLNSIHLNVG